MGHDPVNGRGNTCNRNTCNRGCIEADREFAGSRVDIVQEKGLGIITMAVAGLQWRESPSSGKKSASQDPAWNALLACFVTDGHHDNLIKVHTPAPLSI